ncbi:MAG: ABC transporter permease [Defluviitaleaceae bacterium]|nr:ABC transporter permease [Defluviitaleaceae bacterium]
MKLGMIKYHLLLLFREPLILFFGFALPLIQLFFAPETLTLGGETHHFMDISMPLSITIAVMALCFMDSAFSHAYSRQIKFLRRLRMTPVKPVTYIFTGIVSRLGVVLVFTVIFLAVSSVIFDVSLINRNWIAFISMLTLTFLMFYFMGMFVANMLKDSKHSQSALFIVFFGFIFLINIIPALETLPDILQSVVQNFPVFYATNLLQSAWTGASLLSGHELIGVIVLTVIFGVLSVKFFKYE